MPTVKYGDFNLFCTQLKFIAFSANQTSDKHQLKVHVYHYVHCIYSRQLFFGGLVTIILVVILKVGGVDKTIW